MLHQVLQEIEAAQGAINLNELSQKLSVEPSALAGMIQYWVRKGRLKDDLQESNISSGGCSSGACGGTCPGPQGCPFIIKLPQTYTLTQRTRDCRST